VDLNKLQLTWTQHTATSYVVRGQGHSATLRGLRFVLFYWSLSCSPNLFKLCYTVAITWFATLSHMATLHDVHVPASWPITHLYRPMATWFATLSHSHTASHHVTPQVSVPCVGMSHGPLRGLTHRYMYTPGGLLRKPPLKCAGATPVARISSICSLNVDTYRRIDLRSTRPSVCA